MNAKRKRLLLMRHAKSSWSEPHLRDHDRPLNRRGRHNAPLMGERLAQRDLHIDRLISSTANRARTTAHEVAKALRIDEADIELRRELYHASPDTILSLVRQLPESLQGVILFGHNPGFHDCVERLAELRVAKFRTAAVACFWVAGPWRELRWGQVQLEFLDDPRQAEAER